MSYAMDPYEKRVELPSVQEVFYGPREPTFLVNDDLYHRRPHMVPPPAYRPRDVDPVYRTRALVAPSSTQTHVVPVEGSKVKIHPKGLVLSVPMCCEKCMEKVRKTLQDLEGVRDVKLDQYNQLVTIHGDVDPEKALRRVRRVKKKSMFWRMATQPLQYSGHPATGQTKTHLNAYRAPGYHTSAYRGPGYHTSAYSAPGYHTSAYSTPGYHTSAYSAPRYHTSAYSAPSSTYTQYFAPPHTPLGYTNSSRPYSSPYIDSAYRSGYVEPHRIYAPGGRFAHDDLEYRPRFDRGTPYLQMNDV